MVKRVQWFVVLFIYFYTVRCLDNTVPSYANIFDVRGQWYNMAMLENPHARKEEILPILIALELTIDENLVDVPAGGGFLAHSVSSYIPNILVDPLTIVEIEPSEIFARTHAVPGVQTISCSVYNLPLEDASVSKIASVAGLHHLTDEEKTSFFTEVYRYVLPLILMFSSHTFTEYYNLEGEWLYLMLD